MNDFTATQCCLFGELFTRPVLMQFDQTQGTSDGGAVLLRAANQRYGAGLIEALTARVVDRRQAGKVEHSVVELMRQRVYGLACGYDDANDAARIGADPMHKLLAGRDPNKGLDLASQPTLSRFENAVGQGTQQLSFFNAHYDNWCYLPTMSFVSFDDEPDQYLCATVLRPGNVTAAAGAIGVLRRLIELVRAECQGRSKRGSSSHLMNLLWHFAGRLGSG